MTTRSWNTIVASLPNAHFLQTQEWAHVKAPGGWKALYRVWRAGTGDMRAAQKLEDMQPYDARDIMGAAQILVRTVAIGGFAARLRILYVPKGPLLDWSSVPLRRQVLADLVSLARQLGAIFVKLDPDLPLGTGEPGTPGDLPNLVGQSVAAELVSLGWRFSSDQIQFRNTVQIDLTPGEDELLANMKQKTRYNVRLATKKGVTIRPGTLADLDLLYQMYAETSVRDGFVIRERAYYHSLWSTFMQAGLADPLIAEVEGAPVSAVVIFRFGGRAWYKDGMSRDLHREKMPTYLLQWEAMCRAKAAGCHTYDLWGAPDEFNEQDSMWGVYRFKEGLGGHVVRHLGAWDYPVQPLMYRLYTQTLPRLLDILRRRGKAATRRQVEGGPAGGGD